MEAALGLVTVKPATRAGILSGRDRAGRRRAADRDVADVVERVTRQLVLRDVVVDVVIGPRDERVDLDDAFGGVVGDDRRVGALGGVDALQAGDPRRLARQRLVERDDLAQLAAAGRAARLDIEGDRPGSTTLRLSPYRFSSLRM